jgi:hypothetical protein
MPFPISLEQQDYEALVALAREGVKSDPESVRKLESFLRLIEQGNGIHRYFLWVQWQEANQPLPPSTDFPEKWPPELRASIELVTRPIAKVDVEKLLAQRARKPVSVLVTPDPAGIVGWTELNAYFIN